MAVNTPICISRSNGPDHIYLLVQTYQKILLCVSSVQQAICHEFDVRKLTQVLRRGNRRNNLDREKINVALIVDLRLTSAL